MRWMIVCCLIATTAAAQPTQPPDEVRLLLNWFPEAEHGGFYAAQVHGYYEDAGLDVTILPGGPDTPTIQRVAVGAVEFGVENADLVVLGRAQGTPVVAVMAALQTSPRCIMVHGDSGIERLDQLRDLTLAMQVKGAFSHYLRRHVPLTDVRIVPYSGNVMQFLRNPTFAQQAYIFSEPYVARSEGADPRCLLLSEIGFNPYTSMLLTNEQLIQRRPDLVQRMVAASLRGWVMYLDDPRATNEEIHRLNPEMGMGILDYGVETLRPLARDATTELHGYGHIAPERMRELVDQLERIELIAAGSVTAASTYDTRFLAAARVSAATR